VIPYISITGDCGVTLLSGTANRTGGTCPTRTTTTGRGKGKEVTRTLQTRTTEGGIGDTILRGRYYVLEGGTTGPTVVIAHFKVPTADSKQGLGTGRSVRPLVRAHCGSPPISSRVRGRGYTLIGHARAGLRNQWYYDLGLGYTHKTLQGLCTMKIAHVQGSKPAGSIFALN
jgi:hypothetical protein